ncbi:MAG: hypothetical protein P4L43_04155 [Syntrophobacteraceae bacterium]|nr:hypothetical protein [Syntrophobacteraceae bacterium]
MEEGKAVGLSMSPASLAWSLVRCGHASAGGGCLFLAPWFW